MRFSQTLSLGVWLALAAGTLVAPGLARGESERSFWDFADTQKTTYERHMREADQSALAAALPLSDIATDRRFRLTENAIAAYELAAEADPSQAEPHYRAAELLRRHYLSGDISPRAPLRRAIRHLRAFVSKAPEDPRLGSVYNELAVNLTKLYGLEHNNSDLEAAIVNYDKELGLVNQSGPYEASSIAILLSNRAEVHMMLGRLEQAIEGYEESISFSDDPLAGYGLAVALDRDGQRTRARDVARLCAEGDGGNRLVAETIFFVPFGEEYYYHAIRYEALGEYRNAVTAYRQYLRLLPRAPWAPMARRNLAELVPKAAKQPVDTLSVEKNSQRAPRR